MDTDQLTSPYDVVRETVAMFFPDATNDEGCREIADSLAPFGTMPPDVDLIAVIEAYIEA